MIKLKKKINIPKKNSQDFIFLKNNYFIITFFFIKAEILLF